MRTTHRGRRKCAALSKKMCGASGQDKGAGSSLGRRQAGTFSPRQAGDLIDLTESSGLVTSHLVP